MMIVGHSLHRFLGEPWRSSELYHDYTFVRGLSSALFLTIAGFSFVVASMGHMDEYTRFSPKLLRRLRRIAVILFLGMALQLPAPTLYETFVHASKESMERLFAFNVLQNIAFGLLLLHGILLVTGSAKRFRNATVIAALFIIAIAPVAYAPTVDTQLPAWLQGAVNLSHGAVFPIVPFTAFICMGAFFGAVFLQHRGTEREPWVFVAASVVGIALLAIEQILRNNPQWGLFPYSPFHSHVRGPGNTFARAGCALLLISLLYAVGRYRVFLPKLSQLMSRSSLAIYVVHLVLVYGGAQMPGIFASHKATLTPLSATGFIIALFVAMVAMAKLLVYLDTHHRRKYQMAERTILVSFLVAFLFLPQVTPLLMAATLVLVSMFFAFPPVAVVAPFRHLVTVSLLLKTVLLRLGRRLGFRREKGC